MRKIFLFLLTTALLTTTTKSQVFMGTGFHNRGYTLTGGYMAGDFEAAISADMPYTSNEIPGVYSITAGYMFTVGKIALTPSAGVARVRYKEYGFYDHPVYPQSTIIQVRKVKKVLGIEAGIDNRAGRLYAFVKHADKFYGGLGAKVYF